MSRPTPTERRRCTSIYWNLISLLEEKPDSAITQNYVREMYQTERCDHCHDFSDLRSSFERHLENEPGDSGAIQRIREYNTTDQDDARALQTLVHYWSWHRDEYRRGLPWYSQIYYYTWYRAEKTIAAIGLLGGLYAARRRLPAIIRAARARVAGTFWSSFRFKHFSLI